LPKNVTIEPFATIYQDVVIGEGSWIGPYVTIMPGTRIGKNCKIYPGAVVGGDPQDLKYRGEYTTTEIGDNNIIRECVTINKGTSAKRQNRSRQQLLNYGLCTHCPRLRGGK
jgi:Acyl-[acyl carrier protein]--UDP-N-acetylglucosamine O-acyltransferase